MKIENARQLNNESSTILQLHIVTLNAAAQAQESRKVIITQNILKRFRKECSRSKIHESIEEHSSPERELMKSDFLVR